MDKTLFKYDRVARIIESRYYFFSSLWYIFLFLIFPMTTTAMILLKSIIGFWALKYTGYYFAFVIFKYFRAPYLQAQIDHFVDSNRVTTFCGPLRTGKSVSIFFNGYNKAMEQYFKAYREYISIAVRLKKFAKNPEKYAFKLERFGLLDKAFNFYEKQGTIPFFHTNIKVEVNGMSSNPIGIKHLQMLHNLPEYVVIAYDETSLSLPLDFTHFKSVDIATFIRFLGQFFDGYIYFGEQDQENIYKDVRRVINANLRVLSQDWFLRPSRLEWYYNKIWWLIDKKILPKKPWVFNFLEVFKYCYEFVGYRKIKYELVDRKDTVTKKATYYIPSRPVTKYDSRAFRKLNKAIDQEFQVLEFAEDYLTEEMAEELGMNIANALTSLLNEDKLKKFEKALERARLEKLKQKTA